MFQGRLLQLALKTLSFQLEAHG